MTLIDLLKNSAQQYPAQTALIYREKTISYKELWNLVLKHSAGFQLTGIQKNDKVILLLKNSPEFIISVFALSYLGAWAIPVNFYQKAEEIIFICKNSQAKGFITQPNFLNLLIEVQKKYDGLKNIWCSEYQENAESPFIQPFEKLEQQTAIHSTPQCLEDDICLMLYTSGTTGKSKGVMLSHHNLTSNSDSAIRALDLKHSDRFLCILPMFHVFAWTANVLVPLQMGCLIVIVESIRPPKPWLNLIQQQRITIFAAVPQMYTLLAQQAIGFKKWVLRFLFFRSVRMCISGSAPLGLETLKKFEQRLGKPLLEGYGLTETSPVTHANTFKAKKAGSVGKSIPEVQTKIIDENENILAANQEGEICITGPNIMKGYYQLPEETKATFTQDGWLKTGDIGLIDNDGFLFIRDRIKDMIIVKGLKVFSIQIEEILLSHPAVEEAAVVGIPDNNGSEMIKGFIVLKQNMNATKSEILKLCQEKLPPYKRPRDIEILKELPKNALQKVLKRELRKLSSSETKN